MVRLGLLVPTPGEQLSASKDLKSIIVQAIARLGLLVPALVDTLGLLDLKSII